MLLPRYTLFSGFLFQYTRGTVLTTSSLAGGFQKRPGLVEARTRCARNLGETSPLGVGLGERDGKGHDRLQMVQDVGNSRCFLFWRWPHASDIRPQKLR